MANKINYITPAKDCSYIDIEANLAVHINECFINKNIFRISNTLKEEELPLLTYDYTKKKWFTGRFIGKIYFTYLKQNYCFEVIPRFGNATVMHLLEEVFNIKLAHNNSSNTLQSNHNELVKKLISVIWVKQLSKANIHGLPKHKIKKQYKGSTIKGRINIKKSLLPIYNEKLIISERTEKEIDETIVTILYQAYKTLCKSYYLTQNMLTENVQEIVNNSQAVNHNAITENQYRSIKYGSMYSNYKNIVDFSWNIIQRKKNNLSDEHSTNSGDALFLDMAEIWESYLRSILKKKYSIDGWKIYSNKYTIYNKQYFKRGIIPDIIIEKENNVVVFDAKYKNMESKKFDYDRSDFFQIHTYGAYMKAQNKKLLGLGLLYPLLETMSNDQLQNNFSETLYGESNSNTWFKVDGIKLSANMEELTRDKNAFLSRIEDKLMVTI